MKLIENIIIELSDINISLTSPLLKTKLLASRLKNQNLLFWVNKELGGYDNISELPIYRIYSVNLIGTYRYGTSQYNDQPIPTIGLNENYVELLTQMHFTQSVESLEFLKSSNKSGNLEQTFPSEITGIVQENFRKLGNPKLQLIYCKKSISISAVNETLAIIRNKLLDFMLQIDSEFGNITELNDLKTKNNEISTIMNQTIINNSGDGIILNTGDNVTIKSSIIINKGNKEELVKYLKSIGVTQDDADELITIIDSEKPNIENKTFGKNVNHWIEKMLGKVLNGSWQIAIGAAGNLLSEAIKLYYLI
ncbi:MAG: hypothetical protein RL108_413 [Bacteroidota bacterium]